MARVDPRELPTRFGFLLLDGYRCSIHRESFGAMTLEFPKLAVSRSIYTIDRDRFTSSGGTAPMDMMLYFVRRQLGPQISTDVADQFVHERIRDPKDRQHAEHRARGPVTYTARRKPGDAGSFKGDTGA